MSDQFQPKPLKMPSSPRPPRPRRPPALPTGPRLFRPHRNMPRLGGPGLPPSGFVTRQHTASEWQWYWASMRVLDPTRDPREPPYTGGLNWHYQTFASTQFGASGASNIDFFYTLSEPPLAVRIQTYRYHTAADSIKQAYDAAQARVLMGRFDLVDVFEGFVGDVSGQTAVLLVKQVLGLVRAQNPITAGMVQPVRNAITG